MDTKGNFSDKEKAILKVQPKGPAEIQAFLNETMDAMDRYDGAHTKGIRKLGRKLTDFGAVAHEIMQNLSPLISLVQDIGAPFGGTATGVIAFFFSVRF